MAGKPIVAELVKTAEDKRDELSIILAGFEDDIHQKLYAYNDGLPSPFNEVFLKISTRTNFSSCGINSRRSENGHKTTRLQPLPALD